MVLGFAAIGQPDQARGARAAGGRSRSSLFGFTRMEMAAMLVFALTGIVWVAIAALLGVFFARDMAGPL